MPVIFKCLVYKLSFLEKDLKFYLAQSLANSCMNHHRLIASEEKFYQICVCIYRHSLIVHKKKQEGMVNPNLHLGVSRFVLVYILIHFSPTFYRYPKQYFQVEDRTGRQALKGLVQCRLSLPNFNALRWIKSYLDGNICFFYIIPN